jgi:hypothetical protein
MVALSIPCENEGEHIQTYHKRRDQKQTNFFDISELYIQSTKKLKKDIVNSKKQAHNR